MRSKVQRLVGSRAFQATIMAVIVINSIVLGVQTAPLPDGVRFALDVADASFLAIYVIEIALKLYAWRSSFFKDGWNVFDLVIVLLSIVPASILPFPAQALRLFRVFRAFRVLLLVSALARMRTILDTIVRSLPSVAWTVFLLAIVSYVYAIIGVTLYGDEFPEYFGNLGATALTLFQLATLEGWPDIARDVMSQQPFAWVYFVTYIVVAAFIVVNVIVGIIVNSLQESETEANAGMTTAGTRGSEALDGHSDASGTNAHAGSDQADAGVAHSGVGNAHANVEGPHATAEGAHADTVVTPEGRSIAHPRLEEELAALRAQLSRVEGLLAEDAIARDGDGEPRPGS